MMISLKKITASIVIILFFFSCGAPQKSRRIGLSGKAVASWYGSKFHGRLTASGEKFNMYDMTCAHKTLPLGTLVKIKNIENGKSLVVRVNDRGPFIRGRDFDLSYGAARKLDLIGVGVAEIYFECIDFGNYGENDVSSDQPSGQTYTIQIGSFSDESNARKLKKSLTGDFPDIRLSSAYTDSRNFYRVRIGCFSTRAEAEKSLIKLENSGHPGFVVSCEGTDECK